MRVKSGKIREFISKEYANDIFVTNNDAGGANTMSMHHSIKVRRQKLQWASMYNKIKIITNMKVLNPYFLIKLLLEKIKIAK